MDNHMLTEIGSQSFDEVPWDVLIQLASKNNKHQLC